MWSTLIFKLKLWPTDHCELQSQTCNSF